MLFLSIGRIASKLANNSNIFLFLFDIQDFNTFSLLFPHFLCSFHSSQGNFSFPHYLMPMTRLPFIDSLHDAVIYDNKKCTINSGKAFFSTRLSKLYHLKVGQFIYIEVLDSQTESKVILLLLYRYMHLLL